MDLECWNSQCPRRLDMLMALKKALHERPVPAPFWACLQVCDLEKLAELVEMAKGTPEPVFNLLERGCLSIALNWMELLPYGNYATVPSRPLLTDSISISKILTRERDGKTCLISKDYSLDVLDIVPASVVKRDTTSHADGATPDFWQMLGFFFTENRIERWKRAIATVNDTDSCRNQICVTNRIKWRWRAGVIAMFPVEIKDDTLTVDIYWQSRPKHSRFQLIDILQPPEDTKDLIGADGCSRGLWVFDPGCDPVPLTSGDRFFIKTHNPRTHPLPMFELLEMHWQMNQIVSLSGAVKIFDKRGSVHDTNDLVWQPSLRQFGNLPMDDDSDVNSTSEMSGSRSI